MLSLIYIIKDIYTPNTVFVVSLYTFTEYIIITFLFLYYFSPRDIVFCSLQSMQSIVINCIFLILIVIVLLLWGVVIDKIKVVVVVVIKFNHIRVGKTICCKLGGQRNFWKCLSLRHFGQLCILSIPDAIKRIYI